MKKSKFKLGDKVKTTRDFCCGKAGWIGKIVSFYGLPSSVGIEFDSPFEYGHDCNGSSRSDRGHYLPFNAIESISRPLKTKVVAKPAHNKQMAAALWRAICSPAVKKQCKKGGVWVPLTKERLNAACAALRH